MHDAHCDNDAERRAEGKAEQRRGQCHPGIVDQAAVRGDAAQEGVLEEVHRHLVRRRQRRLRLRQSLADEFDGARRLIGALVEIALERRVEDDGEDIPQHHHASEEGGHWDDLGTEGVH